MRAQNEAEVLRRANSYIEYVKAERADCITAKMPCEIVEVGFDEKYVTYAFETEDWMMNPGGVLHGGIICTMFDIAMGVTTRCFSGYYSPTVNLSVTYLCPIPNDERVLFTARVTRLGSTFVQVVSEAKLGSSGEMCATASATFYCNKDKVIINKQTGERL